MTDKTFEEGLRKAGRALGEQMDKILIECLTTPPPVEASTEEPMTASEWMNGWLDQASASWPPAPIVDREADFDNDPWAGGPYGL